MAEVSDYDLIELALTYREEVTDQLIQAIIDVDYRSDLVKALLKRQNKSQSEGERISSRLEKIQLVNTIISDYIARRL